MAITAHAQRAQTAAEGVGLWLTCVLRDNHAAHEQVKAFEFVHQTQDVFVVGNAVVAAYLAFLNGVGGHHDNDLGLVLQALQHAHFHVGFETREHAGCVVIIAQFAAKFQIQLTAELVDALADVLRLQLDVFLVIEPDFHAKTPI